jgi:hypothetical protein
MKCCTKNETQLNKKAFSLTKIPTIIKYRLNRKNYPHPSPQKLRKLSPYNYHNVLKVVYI